MSLSDKRIHGLEPDSCIQYGRYPEKDVKEFIKKIKGEEKSLKQKVTKKYLRKLYGIKEMQGGRWTDGFYEALRYFGYKSEKAKKRIDKEAGEKLI